MNVLSSNNNLQNFRCDPQILHPYKKHGAEKGWTTSSKSINRHEGIIDKCIIMMNHCNVYQTLEESKQNNSHKTIMTYINR